MDGGEDLETGLQCWESNRFLRTMSSAIYSCKQVVVTVYARGLEENALDTRRGHYS